MNNMNLPPRNPIGCSDLPPRIAICLESLCRHKSQNYSPFITSRVSFLFFFPPLRGGERKNAFFLWSRYTHTHTYTYTRTHIYTYTHTYIHTHTHTHTHTYTHIECTMIYCMRTMLGKGKIKKKIRRRKKCF